MKHVALMYCGSALDVLGQLPAETIDCCVTSPPYFGLRDYGADGQIGLESVPEVYVETLIGVFREVSRVLKPEGTLWLNLGDSFASAGGAHGSRSDNQLGVGAKRVHGCGGGDKVARVAPSGLKPKDLIGIPWRVALALQVDGWYLRSDIIWAKPNPMPESVTDRPTRSHEYVFLLSKSARYYYDAKAIAEPITPSQIGRVRADAIGGASWQGRQQHSRGGVYSTGIPCKQDGHGRRHAGFNARWSVAEDHGDTSATRNARDVWTITPQPYKGAHFATFPQELARRCILAGCPPGGVVLDPFCGSGTTLQVAVEAGRQGIGIELNPTYCSLAQSRLAAVDAELVIL